MAEPVKRAPVGDDPVPMRDWGVLKDVPFRLTVEIGGTRMRVRDILELDVGSLVVTDKLSGEPVDLALGGEVFGRAEVVILQDKLCVRLNNIVGSEE
ncbi:MAG: hypothetical protein Kow0092_14630 [Deferrisomatales bacterium]